MAKAMISQPMRGKSVEAINEDRRHAIEVLNDAGYEVVDTYSPTYTKNANHRNKDVRLLHLAHAIETMSACDAVFFCKGWEYAEGCLVEHQAAVSYGIKCLYE